MKEYSDETAAGTVAAFLIMRGQHWWLSLTTQNSMKPETAKLMLTDYGRPRGNLQPVSGKPYVFEREFEQGKVTLDCNDWSATFPPSRTSI
eukprot:UC1_evm1s1267